MRRLTQTGRFSDR